MLIIWLLAIGGWFINNRQIPIDQKLASDAEEFLTSNTINTEQINCVVNQDKTFGTCNVLTTEQDKIVVQCPIKSVFSSFTTVFFVKGAPCIIVTQQ